MVVQHNGGVLWHGAVSQANSRSFSPAQCPVDMPLLRFEPEASASYADTSTSSIQWRTRSSTVRFRRQREVSRIRCGLGAGEKSVQPRRLISKADYLVSHSSRTGDRHHEPRPSRQRPRPVVVTPVAGPSKARSTISARSTSVSALIPSASPQRGRAIEAMEKLSRSSSFDNTQSGNSLPRLHVRIFSIPDADASYCLSAEVFNVLMSSRRYQFLLRR